MATAIIYKKLNILMGTQDQVYIVYGKITSFLHTTLKGK